MTWQMTAAVDARNYADVKERTAFMSGYSDGYNGHDMQGEFRWRWPNAYPAGYWDGVADRLAQHGFHSDIIRV